MKRKLLSIFALLLIAVSGAWAQTETIETNQSKTSYSGTNITINVNSAGNSSGAWLSNSWPITISTNDGVNITKVVLTIGQYAGYAGSVNANPGTCVKSGSGNGTTFVTITDINASSVTIGSGSALKVSKVEVTYTAPPVTYSVSLADGTELADQWTISPSTAEEGETVTLSYTGNKHVKSIKAVKKAATVAARPAAEATAEDLGKIVGADGNIYDSIDAAETAGTTAVAMIAYIGSDTDNATYTHGLAIALSDENGSMNWNTALSTCESKTAVTDAAWLLPSKNQWNAMFSANGGNAESYNGLDSAIITAGGTVLENFNTYWSSTEDSYGQPWNAFTCMGSVSWQSSTKNQSYLVRACLAF